MALGVMAAGSPRRRIAQPSFYLLTFLLGRIVVLNSIFFLVLKISLPRDSLYLVHPSLNYPRAYTGREQLLRNKHRIILFERIGWALFIP